MKFSVATLLWLVTFAAVVMGSCLWATNEKDLAEKKVELAEKTAQAKIAKSEQENAVFKKNLENYARNEAGKAFQYRHALGVIENAASVKAPFIKLVRMPSELGGEQSYKLPFTWQWRMILPDPAEFELCWAVHEIPADDSFDIPEEHLHRSHLNLKGGVSRAGLLHFGNPSGDDSDKSLDSGKPLEVCLFFRIDGDSENADVFINYQVVNSEYVARGGLKRGEYIQLKSDDVSWLHDCTYWRGGYGSILGFGLERGDHVPLLQQTFSLDEPLTIVKVRSEKKLAPFEYETYKEPCPGLLVWIQKKTGPSTDQPKRILGKPDSVNR